MEWNLDFISALSTISLKAFGRVLRNSQPLFRLSISLSVVLFVYPSVGPFVTFVNLF